MTLYHNGMFNDETVNTVQYNDNSIVYNKTIIQLCFAWVVHNGVSYTTLYELLLRVLF